ncbi:MCE family protein [Amycolatopsis anabasis]|uniref:MCE family protein n=1 Tax=Amycolatopsis anabasis TaxID=1840409 RepID=UPI00131DE89B|nr:MCE family protein [Amycolatopsis anabasis]
MSRPGLRKLRLRTAGLVFLLVMAALITLSIKVYNKDFVTSVPVTLRTDRIGNQLHVTSEVKARGVVVGEVRRITSTGTGAEIELALEPGKIAHLPKDVSALLIPKTLFGERYVQLSIPDRTAAPPIAAGDVIPQDRSGNAIELEKVFDNLLPVLKAVQPQKLATTLTAISTALRGRGDQIGDTLVTAANYLEKFNPNLPRLNENIRDLAEVSKLYGDIAPDVLDSLTSAAVTLRTVSDKRAELGGLYDRVTSSSQDTTAFLRDNKDNLIRLSAASRAPLELAARYSPSFPCTLDALTALKPSLDRFFGKDSAKPGMQVEVRIIPDTGKYLPGQDDPVYNAKGGPRCYPSGVTPAAGVAAAEPGSAAHPLVSGDGLGLPNSPQERELIAGLVAPSLGVAPGQVPGWSSVLVGPLYRGTEVTLK